MKARSICNGSSSNSEVLIVVASSRDGVNFVGESAVVIINKGRGRHPVVVAFVNKGNDGIPVVVALRRAMLCKIGRKLGVARFDCQQWK